MMWSKSDSQVIKKFIINQSFESGTDDLQVCISIQLKKKKK